MPNQDVQLHIAGPFEAGRRRERQPIVSETKEKKASQIAVDPPEPKQITKAEQKHAPRRI